MPDGRYIGLTHQLLDYLQGRGGIAPYGEVILFLADRITPQKGARHMVIERERKRRLRRAEGLTVHMPEWEKPKSPRDATLGRRRLATRTLYDIKYAGWVTFVKNGVVEVTEKGRNRRS